NHGPGELAVPASRPWTARCRRPARPGANCRTGFTMIVFNCPHCGLRLGVKEEFAGKKARCQRCSQVCDVPQAAAVASGAAGPESSAGDAPDLNTVLPSEAGAAPGDGQESLPPINHAVARPRVDPDHLLDFLAPSQEPGEIGRLGNYRV